MTIQHEESFFEGKDGARIFEQCWMPPEGVKPRAVMLVVHGLAEHSGRYAHVGKWFAERGFVVGALDHRGHGQSVGVDSEISSMEDVISDLDIFASSLRERVPGVPLFLFGHSMGGLIAVYYVIQRQPQLRGVLLSGAALKISDEISPLLIKVSGLLAKIAPKMKTIKLDGSAVSRDPSVVQRYDADPLNYRGGIPACTAVAMNQAIQHCQGHFDRFSLPVLVMHGGQDRLADIEGSRQMYAGAASTDKQFKEYEGLYHELVNEPEKEQVMGDMLVWMEERLN